MADCPKCENPVTQAGGKCFVCGHNVEPASVETAEKPQTNETAAAERPARKAAAEKR